MVLESGYKIPEILDDFASAELLIQKKQSGPFFVSEETDGMFILTAHLKGYTRQQIKIDINKDGRRIVISGEKPVKNILMVGTEVFKEEIEMRRFTKTFSIPDGVILDQIKTRFNEYESVLTISMPKMNQGRQGVRIEEVKEGEEIGRVNSKSLQVSQETTPMDMQENAECKSDRRGNDQIIREKKHIDGTETTKEEEEFDGETDRGVLKKEFRDQSTQTDAPKRPKKCCTSAIAGSALLVSLLVFVLHAIRNNGKPSKKKR